MSLDVDLMVTQPCSVYSSNITHNLGKMAGEVKVSNGLTLYNVLWRPDEHGFVHARNIVYYLDEGLKILLSDPEYYKIFEPENGWGTYKGLVEFVSNYRDACWDNPEAELSVSR